MKILFWLLSFLLTFPNCLAQIEIGILPSEHPQQTRFFIQKVIPPPTLLYGFLVNEQGKKLEVKLKNKVETTFETYFKQTLQPQNDSVGVWFSIDTLEFSERPFENLINGKLQLDGTFYLIKNLDTLQLTQVHSLQTYQRSINSISITRFEKLLQSAVNYCTTYLNDWIEDNYALHDAFAKRNQVVILPDYTQETADTLYYPNRSLVWDDFRASPRTNGRYGASIFANISYSSTITIENNVVVAYITPKVYMVRGMSWVLPSNKNSYALRHEQLHFAIAQVVMNRYKKKIQTLEANTSTDLASLLQYEYLESYREMNRLQKAYDTETNHGLNTEIQAQWDRKISGWLEE